MDGRCVTGFWVEVRVRGLCDGLNYWHGGLYIPNSQIKCQLGD